MSKNRTFSQEEWLVILLLIFVYPVGLILMWMWTKWPTGLKIVLSLPVILVLLGFVIILGRFSS